MEEHDVVSFRMMLLDAIFTDASTPFTPPTVQLYGVTQEGYSVCSYVQGFLPYFWFPSPLCSNGIELGDETLEMIKDTINQRMVVSRRKRTIDNDSFVASVTTAYRTPLMFYRSGGPSLVLKVGVWRSKDVAAVAKEASALAEGNQLRQNGLLWKDWTTYEDQIKIGMRFFSDTAIAGGAWVEVNCASLVHYSHQKTRCVQEYHVRWDHVKGLTPDATHYMEFSPMNFGKQVPSESHVVDSAINIRGCGDSSLNVVKESDLVESIVNGLNETDSSSAIQFNRSANLTSVMEFKGSEWLMLSPLRVIALHVLCASGGSISGSSNHTSILSKRKRIEKEAVMKGQSKKCSPHKNADLSSEDEGTGDIENLCSISGGSSSVPSRDSILVITNLFFEPGSQKIQKTVVFTHGKGLSDGTLPGINIRKYDTEIAMLLAWQEFFYKDADPDVICLYQLKDSIKYLVERFKALKLGHIDISRCKGQAVEVKSVVSYGKNWVKQQARMTATSNQEVFRATMQGRIVIDVLRVVLVAYNLSTFTIGECSQVFLGRTKETLNPAAIAQLWQGQDGGLYRLIIYSVHEAELAWKLMQKLQVIPETIEMARVTGLTISEVLYKAQMVRVQSLLLRSASREGWLLGGPTISGQLSESPYLIHPKERKTAGFYKDPVVILDFASLYPSLYMAYNLCYTTLVHPEDIHSFTAESLIASPTGAHFVVPSIRRGILPRICGALIAARKLARDKMNSEKVEAGEYAVLDARQKALKICANALYGFTGAGASPQQALPLADSCLSMGAASCKRAVELVHNTFDTATVIYAQTDSVFIKFKGASNSDAVEFGNKAATVISQAFPSPMFLKLEKVLQPFLLLQVNRYAGKDVTFLNKGSASTIFVRGIEVDRRDVPFFVRNVCRAALHEILLKEDVSAALDICKSEIRRLVSGKCSMFELLMTGGLWRVDDHDITRLASATKSPQKNVSGPATAEEGRGPHVALAIRLKRKDPNRQFHIGERIPYVLVANSSRLQDEMAEDPVDAMREKMQPNFHVYLENKLRKPLESILEHVTDSSQLHELFTGSHTIPTTTTSASSNTYKSQALVSKFFKPKPSCLSCRKEVLDEKSLCKDCIAAGAAPSTVISFLIEKQESEERMSRAHSDCLTCHSGGHFNSILCTNIDCPVFYTRYEAPKVLDRIEPSLIKLEQTCCTPLTLFVNTSEQQP